VYAGSEGRGSLSNRTTGIRTSRDTASDTHQLAGRWLQLFYAQLNAAAPLPTLRDDTPANITRTTKLFYAFNLKKLGLALTALLIILLLYVLKIIVKGCSYF